MDYQVENVRVLPVVGYEGLYEVTSKGEVFSLRFNGGNRRVKLKETVSSSGYLHVNLYKNKKMKTICIHRLVAEAFIPNPSGKPEVDHINTIRSDNRVENLRWCTCKENHHNPFTEVAKTEANQKKARDPEFRRKHKESMHKLSQDPEWQRKRVETIKNLHQDPEFRRKLMDAIVKANAKAVYCVELDKVFESASDASRQLGLRREGISACCRGKLNATGGYHFCFYVP